MNLEKIKKFFGFPLDKKHKKNVEKELCNYLHHTGKIICIIIVISQIIMMISISAREGGPFATPRRQWYFYMYVTLFCVSSVFMFVFSYLWNKKKGLLYVLYKFMDNLCYFFLSMGLCNYSI